jgi:KDO2-lipid IV(A) lauroyltransferase
MALYSGINLLLISLFTMLVPRRLYPPFAFLCGFIFYCCAASQRRGVRSNLRVVTGRTNVERLVIATFYQYSCNWCDVMLMIRLKGARLQALIGRRSDPAPLERALAQGKGAILISPHLGNWELGGLGLADLGYAVTVMTFREPDEKVTEQRRRVREERGIGIIYVDRDDASPLAIIEAVNALRRNQIVCLIGDRDGSSNTMNIPFFGHEVPLPVGAAHLSIATGAPVIPVFVVREGDRYSTLMDEAIRFTGHRGDNPAVVREGMQQLAGVFERYIRRYPDQWYNFFDFWGVDKRERP